MGDLAITCPDAAAPATANKSGAYALSWDGDEGATFRVVEHVDHAADAPTFLYEGRQRATTVTGREKGTYRYEVGVVEGDEVVTWSEPCTVMVEPYPLTVAFGFFAVGLFVTVATVALIVVGHRAHRRGELG